MLAALDLPPGTALAATGSLARGEMTPYSDLDLILLHPAGQVPDPEQVEAVWYPIWDANLRLDHAVRTPEDCVAMLSGDPTAALALLDLDHVAGDRGLVERARPLILRHWRRELQARFPQVVDSAIARWRRSGSVVTMTHPDLKHGRGGLRDIELLRALALGNLCDAPPLNAEHRLLLDARTLLHVEARRRRDVLDPEFAADVSLRLGFDDRYELATALAEAARTVDDALGDGLATARGVLSRRATRTRPSPRRPLDLDVVDAGGMITLSRQPDLSDPALLLRVAAAAARTGLPVTDRTWCRLAGLPELPEVWTAAAADDFFTLLSSPAHTPDVVNALDRHGLWTRLVPEWDHIRGRMPRERTHIHTIDQHSLATVARCAAATTAVARPDLLLLAALYHDIGKGHGRPHEQVGAEFVARMAARLGLDLPDRSRVQTLVAEHTTIARLTATTDPRTEAGRDALLDAVHYDLLTVNLLEVLTEADAKSTGPGVWNHRLEAGLRTLAAAARRALTALAPVRPIVHAPDEIGLRANESGETVTVWWRGDYQRGMVRVLAIFAAKAWNIMGARVARAADGTVHAEFDTRSTIETLTASADAVSFIQTYKSGVHSMLPAVTPGPTATYWDGNVLEVRTVDRIAALGALMGVLPEISWLTVRTPGATMIVQAALTGDIDRGRVGRDVTRVLATG
ncbi:PII uridylyl-transferase [Corynebacterium halotolerans YIM 70093 = DSM 44683]|uniref:PII uridylyl-transferase n=2 Tax=Corynebacterium halotolerans TaxID=225326 RepID=M1MYJ8_9CORY|nr:PII uridylyl-transferase [Corynebacterium halotolerans YIM 70093 = DSM 44683]